MTHLSVFSSADLLTEHSEWCRERGCNDEEKWSKPRQSNARVSLLHWSKQSLAAATLDSTEFALHLQVSVQGWYPPSRIRRRDCVRAFSAASVQIPVF